jgi:hypothetical protein
VARKAGRQAALRLVRRPLSASSPRDQGTGGSAPLPTAGLSNEFVSVFARILAQLERLRATEVKATRTLGCCGAPSPTRPRLAEGTEAEGTASGHERLRSPGALRGGALWGFEDSWTNGRECVDGVPVREREGRGSDRRRRARQHPAGRFRRRCPCRESASARSLRVDAESSPPAFRIDRTRTRGDARRHRRQDGLWKYRHSLRCDAESRRIREGPLHLRPACQERAQACRDDPYRNGVDPPSSSQQRASGHDRRPDGTERDGAGAIDPIDSSPGHSGFLVRDGFRDVSTGLYPSPRPSDADSLRVAARCKSDTVACRRARLLS